MSGTFGKAKRGARPSHERVFASTSLAQLEALTRAEYRGIPAVPAGAPIFDWRVCGCDYVTPLVDGRPARQADDPRYEWKEEASKTRKSLSAEVRRMVLLYGLGYFHAKDAFRSFPGFPDCKIWHPGLWSAGRHIGASGGRIVRELKPPSDAKFYGQQLATMTTMRLGGDDVGTWSSCCLLCGRISAELMALAGVDRPHREDHYARPGGRPAVSGTRWDPGTVPAETPAPASTRTPRTRKTPAAAPAPATPAELVAELLGDAGATGYVIPAGAVSTELAADMVTLRRWLTAGGITAAETSWPIRLVHAGDVVSVQARGRDGIAWRYVCTAEAFPAAAAGRLSTVRVAHSDPRTLMAQLHNRPGGIRQLQGVTT